MFHSEGTERLHDDHGGSGSRAYAKLSEKVAAADPIILFALHIISFTNCCKYNNYLTKKQVCQFF